MSLLSTLSYKHLYITISVDSKDTLIETMARDSLCQRWFRTGLPSIAMDDTYPVAAKNRGSLITEMDQNEPKLSNNGPKWRHNEPKWTEMEML